MQVVVSGLLVQEYSYQYSSGDGTNNDPVTECVLLLEDAQAYFDFTLDDATNFVPDGTASADTVFYNQSAPAYFASYSCPNESFCHDALQSLTGTRRRLVQWSSQQAG